MKIIIVIKFNPYFQASASANRWLTLIHGLAKLGAKVELLIYGGYGSETEAGTWASMPVMHGISIRYLFPQLLQGYWKVRYHTYVGHKLRERRILSQILKELGGQEGIVWTDSSHFGFKLAILLKKHSSHPKLFLELSEFLDIHKYNKGNFLQRRQADKRQRYFEQTAFHAYDGFALMTKTLYRHYQQFPGPGPKLLHLPMTVDLDRFSKTLEPLPEFEKPYVAFVGTMNDAKDGVSILIKSFAQISNYFKELKLYLIGPWNYDTPIHKKLIKELGLEARIFWKGEFNRDQVPGIISNASLLVLPRPDSKQAQGGFPTKLGEYLATGNPVCATRVGEIPDYLVDGESVYFAEPGSVDSFAEAMRRALSNPDEAKRVGLNGRKIAEKYFNKDVQAKMLYNFLKELL